MSLNSSVASAILMNTAVRKCFHSTAMGWNWQILYELFMNHFEQPFIGNDEINAHQNLDIQKQ